MASPPPRSDDNHSGLAAAVPNTSIAEIPWSVPIVSATETTPLIVPHEPEDGGASCGDSSPSHMFWKEIRVLASFTLPIWGFVITLSRAIA
jgi:hypothetical protein